MRSARIRLAVVAGLRPALSLTGRLGDPVLFALASLGESDPEVRERYVDVVDAIEEGDHEAISRVPCLASHDAQTLAALERLYRRVADPTSLTCPLFVGGLLFADGPALGREFLAHCETHGGYIWNHLYRLGYRQRDRDRDPQHAFEQGPRFHGPCTTTVELTAREQRPDGGHARP